MARRTEDGATSARDNNSSDESEIVAAFRAVVAAANALANDPLSYRGLGEADLLEINRLRADAQRALGGASALIAGEVARRSAPTLGSQGLAQRAGFRTPEQFIKITTGETSREATTAVRVGRIVIETSTAGHVDAATGEVFEPTRPWLTAVAEALARREVSVAAADAIRAGLGEPAGSVTAAVLESAVPRLCEAARRLDVDAVHKLAREARDDLDLEGVRLREAERHEQRSVTLSRLPNGMTRLTWLMDTETAASIREVYDRLTSPKRGGVRFVDAQDKRRAQSIADDTRTPAQLASDGFLQLLRLGADVDADSARRIDSAGTPISRVLLGSGAPVIRVTATRSALRNRRGLGRIEGQAAPISIETVERLSCDAVIENLGFNEHGQPLDYGREKRLFDARQRAALSVRDGGCRWPGCDRPPSWCEAHHISFWARDGGRTDVADGILFCKHHHLIAHNNGWEVERDAEDRYWLIPPAEQDPDRRPVELKCKSSAMHDLATAG